MKTNSPCSPCSSEKKKIALYDLDKFLADFMRSDFDLIT